MKETNINDLTTRLTDEESNIVDSIINDLNKDKTPELPSKLQMPGGGMAGQQTPGGMPGQQMPGGMPGGMPSGGMPSGGMPEGFCPPDEEVD